ncbi:M55 family metallopeptidase [Planotetraspora kaengkrachanensis]|uniref:Peptide ABC transporter substrate-binding protein n=1 Tax=Planotetraspora kaengkrachanensis TaxID=575193 RepID=A0A8J3V839_9ACTN|nr:M55 family metallopeptidase [Planotetraspora kaengkrachanensis]GIG81972.1 peptide ABC transporter substrate-binding protein [Planotetraspora kaengkrachanensis]
MKLYVSVDMEGVTGLTDPEEMHAGGRGYERGCELMTGDANAVVEGAFDAGADTVLVNDAHGSTKNLRIDLIDPRASLIRGPGKPHRMGQGLSGDFDAACFAGYHARAGVQHGVLNHTWMGKEIHDVYLNGEICGETRLVAGLAGSLGVPVVLVTGDEAACEEAREVLGDVETVAVKKGIDRFSAELLPPSVAQARIREATARALGRLSDFRPYPVSPPYTLGVEWNSTAIAAGCAIVPGTRLVGPRHTEFTTDDYWDIMSLFGIFATIAGRIACGSGVYG